MSDQEADDSFYRELDRSKSEGRGSACTTWTFGLLLGALFGLGLGLILWFE